MAACTDCGDAAPPKLVNGTDAPCAPWPAAAALGGDVGDAGHEEPGDEAGDASNEVDGFLE